MGYGEDYLIKWFAMFEALDERERLEYFRNYLPIPLDWLDWVAAQFGFDDSKQMDEGKGEFKRIEWLEQHGLANFAEWMKWDDENWKEENLE